MRHPVSGNAAEFFDNAPTCFSTIMARVVNLEVVAKKSTTVGGNAPEFLKFPKHFSTIMARVGGLEVVNKKLAPRKV